MEQKSCFYVLMLHILIQFYAIDVEWYSEKSV